MGFRTVITAALLLLGGARATVLGQSNAAIRWNSAALQGVRDAKLGAPWPRVL